MKKVCTQDIDERHIKQLNWNNHNEREEIHKHKNYIELDEIFSTWLENHNDEAKINSQSKLQNSNKTISQSPNFQARAGPMYSGA